MLIVAKIGPTDGRNSNFACSQVLVCNAQSKAAGAWQFDGFDIHEPKIAEI